MLHYSAINVANSATKLSIFCRITKEEIKQRNFCDDLSFLLTDRKVLEAKSTS